MASQPVSCALTGERTHDRLVGRCEVEGRDLGAELIVSGHCTRCARHDEEGRYADLPAPEWREGVPRYCYVR